MPSFADVIGYADYLRVSPLAIDEDKCVAVRNRNATCRACMEACQAAALTVDRNEIAFDASVCVNCGVCASVCPTSAISCVEPGSQQVLSEAVKRGDSAHGMAVIACERAAARHEADSERFAEVPCLGHLSESLLVELTAAGFDDIVLVDGDCQTCKYGAACPFIDASCEGAADLLEAVGSQAIVTRASSFPSEVLAETPRSSRGEDRRGILLKTGKYVKRVAGNVAEKTVQEKLGVTPQPKTLKDRLGAGKSGRMPTFQPEENFSLLDALEKVAHNPEELPCSDSVLQTRRFGRVQVDAEGCSGCGLCVLFCPTGALSHAEFEKPEREDRKYLEFSASACTQCGMCRDVCIRRCLDVDGCVAMKDLFDLEPSLIEISRPEERTSLFDLKKR